MSTLTRRQNVAVFAWYYLGLPFWFAARVAGVSPRALDRLVWDDTRETLRQAATSMREAFAATRDALRDFEPCGGCRGDWSDDTALPEGWRACGLHLAAAHLRHALDTRGGDPQAWGDHVVEAAERLLGEVWR